MRATKAVLILLVFLAVLITGYYLLIDNSVENDRLFQIEEDEIVRMDIKNNINKTSYIKMKDEWCIEGSDIEIDQDRLALMESQISNIHVDRILQEDIGSLSDYGLEEPALTVGIEEKSGERFILKVGEPSVSNTGYYALAGNKEGILIIEFDKIGIFTADAMYFKDKQVLDFKSNSINRLEVAFFDAEQYVIELNGEANWEFSQPMIQKARNDRVNEIIAKLMDLRVQEYIDVSNDFSQRCLDNPKMVISLKNDSGKIQTLLLGETNEEKNTIYAIIKETNEAFAISCHQLDMEEMSIGNFIDFAPLSISINNMALLEIQDHGETYRFVKQNNQGESIFTLNDNEINTNDFTTLYLNVMSLSAEGYDDNAYDTSDIQMSIILSLCGGERIGVEFTYRDQDTCFMVVNNERTPYYLNQGKVQLVRKWLQKIV